MNKKQKSILILRRIPELEIMYLKYMFLTDSAKISFEDWIISIKGKEISLTSYYFKLAFKLQKFIFNEYSEDSENSN